MSNLTKAGKKVSKITQAIKLIQIVCVCVLALTGQASAGTYADAKHAETAGDYAKAAKLYRALAEQGDARAQNYLLLAVEKGDLFASEELGSMYASGIGFPQDYQRAAKWYLRAAEHGVASSQGKLGSMYASGQGVPQNYVLSYMWLNIASTNAGSEEQVTFIKGRDSVARQMTVKQIAKSIKLASACTTSKFKGCSNFGELSKISAPPSNAKATVITDSKRHDPDASVKTSTTRQPRHEYSDLRDCLNLQSNEAIAKCAGESKPRKEHGTGNS